LERLPCFLVNGHLDRISVSVEVHPRLGLPLDLGSEVW
jgi:hypothetical protein